jgi:acetyl esterase/lipase
VYRPRTWRTGQTALPIIVFFYGGSWQEGERAGYAFAARGFADAGFVVAVPDYRLVPEVRFPAFLEDAAAAVRWVRANAARLGGDPDRIVLVGHSAGAYNAAMLAVDERWLGADRRAVRGLVGLGGPYDFLPLDIPVTIAAFGQERDAASTQPVTFASAGDPPALLLHGALDTTAYPRNSERLAALLRAAGVDARVKLYPKVGHVGIVTALARPFRGRAPVLEDAVAFAREVTR